jgi:small subunit ribosomal protein S2
LGAKFQGKVAYTPKTYYKMKKTKENKENIEEVKLKKTPAVEEISKEADVKDQTALTSIEDYIKTAAYLGAKVVTPTMRQYIYRRRLDGLAILNTLLVDKKLKDALEFVVKFKPEEWILVCKREAGWRAAQMFSELTGVKIFTKKYPSGILTNTNLSNFLETKMIFICDPWIDKNALVDAKKVKVPVVGICNTNNNTADIDFVIIGNNHSNKSLGLFFWLLSKEYMRVQKINKTLPSLEDFAGEKLILEEPKKKKKEELKEDKLKAEEELIEKKFKKIAQEEGAGAREGV